MRPAACVQLDYPPSLASGVKSKECAQVLYALVASLVSGYESHPESCYYVSSDVFCADCGIPTRLQPKLSSTKNQFSMI